MAFIEELERTNNERMDVSMSTKAIYLKTNSDVEKLTEKVNMWINILTVGASFYPYVCALAFLLGAIDSSHTLPLLYPMA